MLDGEFQRFSADDDSGCKESGGHIKTQQYQHRGRTESSSRLRVESMGVDSGTVSKHGTAWCRADKEMGTELAKKLVALVKDSVGKAESRGADESGRRVIKAGGSMSESSRSSHTTLKEMGGVQCISSDNPRSSEGRISRKRLIPESSGSEVLRCEGGRGRILSTERTLELGLPLQVCSIVSDR